MSEIDHPDTPAPDDAEISVPIEGRVVALDTETTGLDPKDNRIVEIGAVEMIDGRITGRNFHAYVNPDRSVPQGAFEVHGLSRQFLLSYPRFAEIAPGFVDFIGGDRLVIHNAPFDLGFLDSEMTMLGLPLIDRARVHDTILILQRRFPGSQVNLSRVCRRFGISTSTRSLHGALIDAELLAQVYARLAGLDPEDLFDGAKGRERDAGASGLDIVPPPGNARPSPSRPSATRSIRPPRIFKVDPAEAAAHAAHLVSEVKDPIWRKLAGAEPNAPAAASADHLDAGVGEGRKAPSP